jgi:hypothetical protein
MARRYDAYIPPPEVRPDEFTMPAGKAWGEYDFHFEEDLFKMDVGIWDDPAEEAAGPVDEASKIVSHDDDRTAGADYHFIGVNTMTKPVTITLPNGMDISSGKILLIKDEGGNASVNAITVTTNDGALIDGNGSVTLVSDYAAISMYYNGSGWHIY